MALSEHAEDPLGDAENLRGGSNGNAAIISQLRFSSKHLGEKGESPITAISQSDQADLQRVHGWNAQIALSVDHQTEARW